MYSHLDHGHAKDISYCASYSAEKAVTSLLCRDSVPVRGMMDEHITVFTWNRGHVGYNP